MESRITLRRFLAWVWAVMRHSYALLAAVLGSFVLTIPGWIGSMLSPDSAKRLAYIMTFLPHTYRLERGYFLA